MINLYVPTILKSKPTGNLNKAGHIYQNTVQYTQFKRESLNFLQHQKPEKTLTKTHGILIVGFLQHNGRAKDLGQLAGAIYDILSASEIWKDDNLRIFDRSISYFYTDKFLQGYTVSIAEKPKEWFNFLRSPDEIKAESHQNLEAYTFSRI